MKDLTPTQRRFLKSHAHHLNPVVIIGQNGLTENVLTEINNTINKHELIKIRVHGDEREFRQEIYTTICETLSIYPIQHIGKTLILYRPANPPVLELPKDQPKKNKRY